MSKIFYLFVILFIFSGCSFNENSKFWTKTEKIKKENFSKVKLFTEEEEISSEFNKNIKLNFTTKPIKNSYLDNHNNNYGRIEFRSDLTKISKYKFSKIDNLHKYEPIISFHKTNIIFFDNKGSILKFNESSKLIWKKNYYTKFEKKQKPILQFANDDKYLIVADNISKFYLIDIETGNLIWSKINSSPFNSQIKIHKDKFYIIDATNTLRCFSIKSGNEIWNIKTQNNLIKSQKKLSMVIVDKKIYFNNSIGDISAVSLEKGELLWQLPTQSSLVIESAFGLETSEIVADKDTIFFSNNKNQFFSIDLNSGSFNWKNKINSSLTSTLVENYILTISLEGFLIVMEKNSGNIIRITDIFNHFKPKKRKKIKPTGFVVGSNEIYLSLDNGRLLIISISTGKTISTLKIDNEKISRPYILNRNLFVIKDNAIIKLN